MTEIQQTNIAVANFIIGELHKEKLFNLVLDAGQTGSLYNITSESHHLHSGFVRKLEATLRQLVSNGTGVILEINPANNIDQFIQSGEFDKAFRDVFGLPSGVVESLGEVS